jgi:hypothetical protein
MDRLMKHPGQRGLLRHTESIKEVTWQQQAGALALSIRTGDLEFYAVVGAFVARCMFNAVVRAEQGEQLTRPST